MFPAEYERTDESAVPEELGVTPRHGFQGDRAPAPPRASVPASLTVALSREAGSRGSTIATRTGAKLGWQVYTQELLEYTAQEGNFRQDVLGQLSPEASRWVEDRLADLKRRFNIQPPLADLARIVLALGVHGGVILVGRGAGYILPRASTLFVRTIAPLPDRIAYMSQWLRLTAQEAAEQVRSRDRRREEFVATHFHGKPSDIHQYDLLLNSSLLGEDVCADLIAQAARAKQATFQNA